MENNNQPETIQSSTYHLLNSVAYSFPSEDTMRTYYIQMTYVINPTLHIEKHTDYVRLKNLQRKLKQFINVLNHLNGHEWGKGILEIQNATGFYMLQNNIERKILLQTHQEVGEHLQFITQLAGNIGYMKQLLGILHCHYQNVEYLIKRMNKKQEETTAQKEG